MITLGWRHCFGDQDPNEALYLVVEQLDQIFRKMKK